MEQYMIYTEKYAADLKDHILLLSPLDEDLKNWEVNETDSVSSIVWKISIKNKKNALEALAHILSDFVQKIALSQFTKEALLGYGALEEQDRETIETIFISNNYISHEQGASLTSYYLIYTPILNFLENHRTFHIEGWLNFRMKTYLKRLENLLEQTVHDFEKKAEYLHIISYFKQQQREKASLVDTLHLVCTPQNQILLFDQREVEVTKIYEHKYCRELLRQPGIEVQDLILHILFQVTPRHIIVHPHQCYALTTYIDTLKLIFSERVTICQGCRLCKVDYTRTQRENLDRS
jgi:putative sporulation protein YtxC